ncbi:MAG: ATP synthase F0 sector subunit c, partial [uncultured Blastococcus sp.]
DRRTRSSRGQHRLGRLRPGRHRPRHRCGHRVGRLHPGDRPSARVRRPDPHLRLPRRRPLRGPGAHRPGRALHLRL